MHYDFDRVPSRKGTDSVKWDALGDVFGDKELLPLWVADMDFPAPPEITENLIKRARHPLYGYTCKTSRYYDAVQSWFSRRFDWAVEKEDILTTPGIVTALALAVEAYTSPGDEIIIQPPVYPPFFSIVKEAGRELLLNPLILKDGTYGMDLEGLEKIISEKTKMLLFCSPHNPVGRVWSEAELSALGDFCGKHGIIIISDEIHCDIVFPEHSHLPLHRVSPAFSSFTVTCTAPSKTFNIPGLYSSNIIITDQNLRNRFQKVQERFHISSTNIFAAEGTIAAYNYGEPWLEALLSYLQENLSLLKERISAMPGVTLAALPEGTYLAWIDFRPLIRRGNDCRRIVYQQAKLGLNDGAQFGEEGEGFMRLNFACPKALLNRALDQLEKALKETR